MAGLLPVITAIFACILLSGCSIQDETGGDPPELYRKAGLLARSGEYDKALALYDKALASDTAGGLSAQAVLELDRKRHLEGLIGNYDEAMRTTRFLERHAGNLLPDSLRSFMIEEKAMWLSELGDFRGAAEALSAIDNPDEEKRFALAAFWLRLGDSDRAKEIYEESVSHESDPVAKIRGLSGLLACSMHSRPAGSREAHDLAMQIASFSGKVLSMEGDFSRRIQALREAAGSLQLLEKHRGNASYLLFRALALAERSKNPFLLQLLRFESNTAVVQKPVPYRETGDYFAANNMQFAEAAALFRLGTSQNDLNPSERVDALRRGFMLYQNCQPRYPGAEMAQLERYAERVLSGILIRQARIFELYDALQQYEMLALQRSLSDRSDQLNLGEGHESLERELSLLQRDIAGLLQRKADIFIKGRGYELNRPAEAALQAKRGRLFELLGEVKKINPSAASVLQMTPVTLQTLQRVLKSGQLIIRPVPADSFFAVMTIGTREFGIAGTPVPYDSLYHPDSGLRRLYKRIASLSGSGIEPLLRDRDYLRFSAALADPVRSVSGRYDHLIVAADPAVPFQLFCSGRTGADEKKISMTSSFREIVHAGLHADIIKDGSPVRFFAADRLADARTHLLFNPGHRVYLLWKPFGDAELAIFRGRLKLAHERERSSSSALSGLYGGDNATWWFISAYGSD
ncbi:MAG: tetratricopeptide repeat protein [Chlorobium sp.]|uniref:tetratricopeptide repeat protein n=1 Tax=Chlorobium sp. TaxID=1095 RepID=UPI002F41B0A4